MAWLDGSPHTTFLHTAAGLYAYGDAGNIEEGFKQAYAVLASGKALSKVRGEEKEKRTIASLCVYMYI